MKFRDLQKEPANMRIVVAMSGGVDSSVAAALLVAQGYDVIGITLQLYDHGRAIERRNACCAGQDIHDARCAADAVGIPHYVLDYESRFRAAVIDDFADSYVRGETPVPCIRCNQNVKFDDLLETARDLGADALATGHYVRRIEGQCGYELHRARDLSKDQSYFLFATTRDQLSFLQFPLGELTKEETRSLAHRFDLPVASKPDSQDVCFVPEGGYASVVEKIRPGALDPGEIVHLDGRTLGRHNGIINYTVGQRRGLGVGGGEAFYVLRLDPASRQVVVGPKDALRRKRLTIKDINWLGDANSPYDRCRATVKLRSTTEPAEATIHIEENGRSVVVLDEPQFGIAPGQACVIYEGDRVLGGGWIVRDDAAIDEDIRIGTKARNQLAQRC